MTPHRGHVILVLAVTVGVLLGVGGYTFIYARGASYLTNDPAACANCHVMQEQFAGWQAASHRRVAVCNDCHAPHDAMGKYVTKARNGFWHSFYFTTGGFQDPIRITAANRAVTEQTCRDCHAPVVAALDHGAGRGEPLACISCHRDVGHLH